MNKRLSDLYELPDLCGEQNLYLSELREHCDRLERQLLDISYDLPMELRMLIEGYIDLRNELEFESVKVALRFGKQQRSSVSQP